MPKKGGESSTYLKKLAAKTANKELHALLRSLGSTNADQGIEGGDHRNSTNLGQDVEQGHLCAIQAHERVYEGGGDGGESDGSSKCDNLSGDGRGLEVEVLAEAAEVLVEHFTYDSDNVHSDCSIDNDDSGGGGGDSDSADDGDECGEKDIRDFLQLWSSQYDVPNNAVSALLAHLKLYHPSLPVDARTLKATPRNTDIKVLKNGVYAHVGLSKGLLSKLKSGISDKCDIVLIDVFVDGVKIYDRVNHECWPIMVRCKDLKDSRPFVVGLFYGLQKPDPINDYLGDYVREVSTLEADGIAFNGKVLKFGVRYYIADAPARAYLKNTVGHTSYHGCERCDQSGSYHNMVVYCSHVGPERTDESFASRRDPDHHKNGNSPLASLGTKFISQFVLDPMHLIDIGVFKRFVHFFLQKGPVTTRLCGSDINLFSELLSFYSECVPFEFCPAPSLGRLSKWKATEYRLLLLYVGIVIFNEIFTEKNQKRQVYKAFLLLHTAIFIMSSDVFISNYIEDAQHFLELFVEYTCKLFGPQFVVYNVHCILHLTSDVKRFGELMSFSAYPFEDMNGTLKRLVRSSSKPVQQICRRLAEKEKVQSRIPAKARSRGLLYEHFDGPTADVFFCSQFERYEDHLYTLSIKEPNNCVCLNDGKLALVRNIVTTEDFSVKVVVQVFESISSFYDYPLPSSDLDVCRMSELSKDLLVYNRSDILYKCVCLPLRDGSGFVGIPILHLL